MNEAFDQNVALTFGTLSATDAVMLPSELFCTSRRNKILALGTALGGDEERGPEETVNWVDGGRLTILK